VSGWLSLMGGKRLIRHATALKAFCDFVCSACCLWTVLQHALVTWPPRSFPAWWLVKVASQWDMGRDSLGKFTLPRGWP